MANQWELAGDGQGSGGRGHGAVGRMGAERSQIWSAEEKLGRRNFFVWRREQRGRRADGTSVAVGLEEICCSYPLSVCTKEGANINTQGELISSAKKHDHDN